MAEVTGDQAALVRDDGRLVAAAANDGRISVDNVPQWMMAMKADRAGTRKTLASLTSVRAALFPGSGADPELEKIHGQVMARLGVASPPGAKPVPRPVAASASPVADARERAILDGMGLPIARVPDPVRLVEGKDPATWTQKERADADLWRLGPAFRAGLQPPPGTARIFQPSPNDHSIFVEGEGWQPNPNYQPRS